MQHNQNSKESPSPKSLVQKHFDRQSEAYTTSSLLSDQGNLDTIIELAEISENDRVLDVATGTGFLASSLCQVAAGVIVTDLTAPMLEQARAKVGNRANASFALADAEHLPFASEFFNAVTCRVAFHHFPHPQAALREMARVCDSKGRIIIMDIVSSEDEAKSEYHNRMERLRDASHIKEYRQSELEGMMKVCELKIRKTRQWPFTISFDEWMRIGGPGAATAEKIRAMMLDSIDGDKSGLRVELREGELFFTYTTAIIVARKEGKA
ncbi:MAG: hypothetical protein COS88_04685 [Chloroflexi bacterium CG07_land_8_20_14_0_80_51_10]|nr:MAG: hypothetical protein COS88_04685 [Chloroflexi bacterium CG07_land_8_20_14_0_80_51_10]